MKPVLVLDLDGTLVDSKPDLVAALNVAIATTGLSAVPMEVVGETIGQGARAMIARAYDFHSQTLNDDLLKCLVEQFLDHYINNIAVHSRPFAGVQDALDLFRENGWQLAVCSNKPERLAKLLLETLDMNAQFGAISGYDTFDVCKPNAGHVVKTIQMAGGKMAGSVMVGDTATDIDTANNADIWSIAVDFGYSATAARDLGATTVISHFDQLWPSVQALGERHVNQD